MTAGYEALTEKEKETLRLLLGGHDAKSIARHLGLSVHTIHERLRDARRKMVVSSSREAARLLHRIESQAPELLGDKPMGDAARSAPTHPEPQSPRSAGEWRRAGWIVGGLAMTISLALLALLAQSSPSLSSGGNWPSSTPVSIPASVAPTSTSEAAATEAARHFRALLDQDDWAGSWKATHTSFQLLNTVEWWAQASQSVRKRLGKPLTRELAGVDFTAAPPNGYWAIRFKARYSKQGSVVETLQLASEGGSWRLAAITVE
jgi:DNA-binding CsgD family transcriptional regulator